MPGAGIGVAGPALLGVAAPGTEAGEPEGEAGGNRGTGVAREGTCTVGSGGAFWAAARPIGSGRESSARASNTARMQTKKRTPLQQRRPRVRAASVRAGFVRRADNTRARRVRPGAPPLDPARGLCPLDPHQRQRPLDSNHFGWVGGRGTEPGCRVRRCWSSGAIAPNDQQRRTRHPGSVPLPPTQPNGRVPRAAALGGDPRGSAPWWGPGAKPLALHNACPGRLSAGLRLGHPIHDRPLSERGRRSAAGQAVGVACTAVPRRTNRTRDYGEEDRRLH